MKRLFHFLSKYKKESILGPVFKLFEALFELIIPLLVSTVIDKGIKAEEPDKTFIILMSLSIILIALCGYIFSIVAQYFNAKSAVGVSKEMRHDLFSKIQSLSYLDLDEQGTSKLVTRMTSDVNQVQTGINLSLRLLLRSPIIVFGALIMAFTISIKLSSIFLIVIVLLLIVVLGIMYICIPLYKKVQNKLDDVTLSTRENLVGVRVIRAFTKEDDERISFYNKNNLLAKAQRFVGYISGLMNPITYVIVNFGIIALLYFGGFEVNNGNLSQGDIVALYNYLSIILVELVKLANLIITINKSIACGGRIYSVLDLEPSLAFKNNTSYSSSYIEFKDVSFSYHKNSDEKALSNINVKIDKGDIVGIIGGTGSGKTTFINLLAHFYDASNGEVCFDGKNVNSYPSKELLNNFGFVPQKSVLFRGTIRSNLLWGNENATEEDINQALEVSQAIDFIKMKEKGLESEVTQGGNNFSGGQKQRLCIARALIKKPNILVLDDSTSALDYQTDFKLRKSLRELDYKPTIFIVSQRTSSIQDANKIIVLDNGRIVGLGTHEELLKNCEEYQEIYSSQVKGGK